MLERDFLMAVSRAGGRAYEVGGCVRDLLLGVKPKDKDYVVTGITIDLFEGLFPEAVAIGRGFPVYSLSIGSERCDIAFARREAKTGGGYRGFSVMPSPDTTIEEDLFRRDLTINSIARDPITGEMVDPYGGVRDIESGIVRATSEHFADDPVRALRAARQSAQFGFRVDDGTIIMMRSCGDELMGEPRERVVGELSRALECRKPSIFFRNLHAARILYAAYPWIASLAGRPQPQSRHPEGDVFEHTMEAIDAAASMTGRVEVRFAVLTHDTGKALTPDESLPRHPDHDALGLIVIDEWNRSMRLPRRWVSCARFAIREHMRVHKRRDPEYITDILTALRSHPIGIDGFSAVIRSDRKDLPDFIRESQAYMDAISSATSDDLPDGPTGGEIGRRIRERQIKAVSELMSRRG
ncbi:MAG: HD domain-containing protein [Synergistaceae bacterium]|jgi:tRNA nucleotidyltransferase (CCA-adding enzyme)|nr:HD domain-containing protein [Synergistaceae bacterium]